MDELAVKLQSIYWTWVVLQNNGRLLVGFSFEFVFLRFLTFCRQKPPSESVECLRKFFSDKTKSFISVSRHEAVLAVWFPKRSKVVFWRHEYPNVSELRAAFDDRPGYVHPECVPGSITSDNHLTISCDWMDFIFITAFFFYELTPSVAASLRADSFCHDWTSVPARKRGG